MLCGASTACSTQLPVVIGLCPQPLHTSLHSSFRNLPAWPCTISSFGNKYLWVYLCACHMSSHFMSTGIHILWYRQSFDLQSYRYGHYHHLWTIPYRVIPEIHTKVFTPPIHIHSLSNLPQILIHHRRVLMWDLGGGVSMN